MRNIRILSVLALAAAVLTGCVKFDMNLTVNKDDTITGTAVFALNKQLAAMGDNESSGSDTNTNDLFETKDGVTSEPYDDGTYVGTKYTFENVPLNTFQTKDAKDGDLRIERVGDDIVVSGNLDMASDSADEPEDEFSKSIAQAMMASFDMKLTITLPGKIVSTNGKQDGQSITWNLVYNSGNQISARANAPQSNPLTLILTAGGGALLIFALFLGLVLARRSKRPAPNPIPVSDDSWSTPL